MSNTSESVQGRTVRSTPEHPQVCAFYLSVIALHGTSFLPKVFMLAGSAEQKLAYKATKDRVGLCSVSHRTL